MKYKFLNHPADVKIKVFGKTKKELFVNALQGMNSILRVKIDKTKPVKKKIKVKSLDLSFLLADFLNNVLSLSQIYKEIYFKIKFFDFTNQSLEVELAGYRVQRFGREIKAITYHELAVQKAKNGGWQGTILFDI